MNHARSNLDILHEFEFEAKPVGVKYLIKPLPGIPELEKSLTLCEMLKTAFEGNAFFAGAKNHACDAGMHVLGQGDIEEQYSNGEFGAGMGIFQEERAAARLYHYLPRMAKGVMHYIALSPFDKMLFNPDVLIILATTRQAEILLRAMSYNTGAMWQSRYSSAVGCAWLFAYPYLNAEINFIATGLGFGIRRRKLFPEGKLFISIPFDKLSEMLQTLREMPWVPRPYQPDGPEYVKQLRIRLGLDRPAGIP
jgi:uncharacterized protein (DUF169 family)